MAGASGAEQEKVETDDDQQQQAVPNVDGGVVEGATLLVGGGGNQNSAWSEIPIQQQPHNGKDGRTAVLLAEKHNHDNGGKRMIRVSNPQVPLPSGLECHMDFLTWTEQDEIQAEIAHTPFVWEGFEQRRKVWRFSLRSKLDNQGDDDDNKNNNNNRIPSSLLQVAQRMETELHLIADTIAVEEYPAAKWNPSGDYASHQRVTTFESSSRATITTRTTTTTNDNKEEGDSYYFVAQIPLHRPAVQHLNQPSKRVANNWKLVSPNHQTDLWMPPGSLWVKTRTCLSDWRFQLRAATAVDCGSRDANNNNNNNNAPVWIVRLYKLPSETSPPNTTEQQTTGNTTNSEQNSSPTNDTFGYIPNPELIRSRATSQLPSLADLLTIVITTSPIQSHPSTELIEKCLETFTMGGHEFAYACQKVIICDGVRVTDSTVTKKHANAKQAMRNGIVNDNQASRYQAFKETLSLKCQSAEPGTLFWNTLVEELEERQGYGFALRHALCHCVSTPYVCVVQHDRTFMRPTPITNVLECMWRHPEIKYVGFTMRSNLLYRDIFNGKYGRLYADLFGDMILRPHELVVEPQEYGHNSRSSRAMAEYCPPSIWKSIQSVSNSYWTSHQYMGQQEWLEQQQQPLPARMHQMSLIPTIFWYDNVHVCETAHYRDFIFHPSYKMVARGGFVEDKLSPVLIRTVERMGLKEGHSRFGCYLLDDHSGLFFTGHLDGGAYLTAHQKQANYPKRPTATAIDSNAE